MQEFYIFNHNNVKVINRIVDLHLVLIILFGYFLLNFTTFKTK